MKRFYNQIVADANTGTPRLLIQIKLHKIINQANSERKPINLTDSQMGEFFFDVLQIHHTSWLKIDMSNGQYDTRKLLVKSGTDLSKALTTSSPHLFSEHDAIVPLISSLVTKVFFKSVPINVPDEEIICLCSLYRDLIDSKVDREPIRVRGSTRHTSNSTNRYIEVKLSPGIYLRKFYWMIGPGQGEVGRRVTVLHPNQRKKDI